MGRWRASGERHHIFFGVEKMLDTRFRYGNYLSRMHHSGCKSLQAQIVPCRLCQSKSYRTSLRTWMAAAGLYEPPISGEKCAAGCHISRCVSEWMNIRLPPRSACCRQMKCAQRNRRYYRDMLGSRDGIRIPGRVSLRLEKALPLLRFPRIFPGQCPKGWEAALAGGERTGALAER